MVGACAIVLQPQNGGLMVNHIYDLPPIAENHEAFVLDGTVTAAPGVARLARAQTAAAAA